jgi:hypothetical protein
LPPGDEVEPCSGLLENLVQRAGVIEIYGESDFLTLAWRPLSTLKRACAEGPPNDSSRAAPQLK